MDWWSLGILIYEMINGLPPFYDANRKVMYHRILTAPVPATPFMSSEVPLPPCVHSRRTISSIASSRETPRLGWATEGSPRSETTPGSETWTGARSTGRRLRLPSVPLSPTPSPRSRSTSVYQHRPCGDSNPCQRGSCRPVCLPGLLVCRGCCPLAICQDVLCFK